MRFLSVIIIVFVLLGCKKKDVSLPPERSQLLFPDKSSECTTGRNINATTSEVSFRWQAAENTETYELRVTDLSTNSTQTINTSSTTAKLPLLKGAPFSWVVTSKSSAVLQTVTSETWQFYNSGYESTYAPFPAEIVTPLMGASTFKDINNEVELSWTGADVDSDIDGYEVYFSTENPPETLVFSIGADTSTRKVTVASNNLYFWKIITKDKEGHSSDSGIYEFMVQ